MAKESKLPIYASIAANIAIATLKFIVVGYGHELYFWSLVVAVLFFVLGGGISVYHGAVDPARPAPLRDPTWNHVVLAGATLLDGTSIAIAYRAFRRSAEGRGFWAHLRGSKDPSQFAVVLEDGADLTGVAFAFLGVFLGHQLDMP